MRKYSTAPLWFGYGIAAVFAMHSVYGSTSEDGAVSAKVIAIAAAAATYILTNPANWNRAEKIGYGVVVASVAWSLVTDVFLFEFVLRVLAALTWGWTYYTNAPATTYTPAHAPALASGDRKAHGRWNGASKGAAVGAGVGAAAWLASDRLGSNLLDDDLDLSSPSNVFAQSGSMFDDHVINPANGMPMIGGSGGVDIEGNAFGTDSHDIFGSDESFSGSQDSFGSSFED